MVRTSIYGIEPQDKNYKIYIIKDDDFPAIDIAKLGKIERARMYEIFDYLKAEYGDKYSYHCGANHIELKYKDRKFDGRHESNDAFVIEWRFEK